MEPFSLGPSALWLLLVACAVPVAVYKALNGGGWEPAAMLGGGIACLAAAAFWGRAHPALCLLMLPGLILLLVGTLVALD